MNSPAATAVPVMSREVSLFASGLPRALRAFRIVYALATLNFAIPVVSYVVRRDLAEGFISDLDVRLGGPPIVETGELWHMLSIGNVAALAFMCAVLWLDVRRRTALVPSLVVLKATSAVVSLALAITKGLPAFYAVAALDGATALTLGLVARAAADCLAERPPPRVTLAGLLLLFPRAIASTLERVEQARLVDVTPNAFQVLLGVLRMQRRIVMRPESVGQSREPVRKSTRARLLSSRALRLAPLLWERAIAPLDLSGLASSPDRIVKHVLGAHHEEAQVLYDLELLSLHPGWLEQLAVAAETVAREETPRARWLADLCVYEGYHADVALRARAMIAGTPPATAEELADPDIALSAHLAWCARQPSSLGALLRGLMPSRAERQSH